MSKNVPKSLNFILSSLKFLSFNNFLSLAFIVSSFIHVQSNVKVGPHYAVCYGTLGNDLPAPPNVINLLKKSGFETIRIYDPNPAILNALRGSKDIYVLVGTKNEDIPSFASSLEAAKTWVNTNIIPYKDSVSIAYVVVGNEVIPGPFAANVAQAMANMKNALISAGLPNIRVSTTTAFNLETSFPPSAGAFASDVGQIMKDVTSVLKNYSTPILVSFYPYFAYVSNPKDISLEYATFRSQTPVMDGQLQYFDLLDAQIDAYHAALAQVGAEDVGIMVAETGWPTVGDEPHTSVENAQIYNANLYKKVLSGKGTPRLPNLPLDVFIFALFDENQKPAGIEQYWGLFHPNMEPKYSFKG